MEVFVKVFFIISPCQNLGNHTWSLLSSDFISIHVEILQYLSNQMWFGQRHLPVDFLNVNSKEVLDITFSSYFKACPLYLFNYGIYFLHAQTGQDGIISV